MIRKVFNFYTIVVLITVLGAVGIRIALGQYEDYLADYEATQPIHVLNDIIDTHFTNPDYQAWAAKMPVAGLSEFEDESDYAHYMALLLADGEVSVHDDSPNKTFTGESKKYTVRSGKWPFATFTMAKTTAISRHGFDIWALGDMDVLPLPFAPEHSLSVSIVRGSTLYINDLPVSDSYFVKQDKVTDSVEHMPEGVEGIVYDLYTVEGLINPPDFHVTDRNGEPVTLVRDEETGVHTAVLHYDTLTADIETLCIDALLAYSKYMTKDGGIGAVGRYFLKGTRLWSAIQTSEVYWYTSHTGYDYQDLAVSEYYRYSDDVFSARVKATQYIYRTNDRTHVYDIDFTFYFARQEDGAFMIYDLTSHV